MKLSIFSPYGRMREETGVLYLLVNYLRPLLSESVQLACNGVFSTCQRDAQSEWKRGVRSCFNCHAEQSALAEWAGARLLNISTVLTPVDIRNTGRMVSRSDIPMLQAARFRGLRPFELCEDTLLRRFGDRANKLSLAETLTEEETAFLRQLVLAAIRLAIATERFHGSFKPDLIFVADGSDALTRTFVEQSRMQGHERIVEFRANQSTRMVEIRDSSSHEWFECGFSAVDVLQMRNDWRTWPREITGILSGILDYLQLSEAQLALPMT